MLHNMNTTDDDKNNDEVLNICASKEGDSNDMNTCNRCKMVKYCNAACKKKHRSKHKKKCDRRIAELHDEQLFEQPPPQYEDCPICFLPMPSLDTGRRYNTCCGKMICSGCIHAPVYDNQGNKVTEKLCPFCRIPISSSDEDNIKRVNRRLEAGDSNAMNSLGIYYANGDLGLPKHITKSLELWHQAGELGHASACHNIGNAYKFGTGLEVDQKKAIHYWELAAILGNVSARHNLGTIDVHAGNIDRGIKHYMIAVRGGDYVSLNNIQSFFKNGRICTSFTIISSLSRRD